MSKSTASCCCLRLKLGKINKLLTNWQSVEKQSDISRKQTAFIDIWNDIVSWKLDNNHEHFCQEICIWQNIQLFATKFEKSFDSKLVINLEQFCQQATRKIDIFVKEIDTIQSYRLTRL